MAEQSINSDNAALAFGPRLANSQMFNSLFRDGMALVEETAAYLDGDGRKESRALERAAALTYATESMRLTTRLMQIASWLLLQRAVNAGELTQEQAGRESAKVKLSALGHPVPAETFAQLPENLRDLITKTMRVQERVLQLDKMIYSDGDTSVGTMREVEVHNHLAMLQMAFNAKQQ